MPDRSRNYDKSPEGIAYRRQYNKDHYAHIGLYLAPELKARLDRYSAENGISKNQIASDAITEYLDRNETGTE